MKLETRRKRKVENRKKKQSETPFYFYHAKLVKILDIYLKQKEEVQKWNVL